jgi:hypothetical protein
MKRIAVSLSLILLVGLVGTLLIEASETAVTANVKAARPNRFYRKTIKGKILFSDSYGDHEGNPGFMKLRTPNLVWINLTEAGTMNGPPHIVKKAAYRNVLSLPFDYSMNVEGVAFIRGFTYSLEAYIDTNVSKDSSARATFCNTRFTPLSMERTAGDVVTVDVNVGVIEY